MARKPGFHSGLVLMLLLIITACSGGGDPISGSLPGGDEELMSSRTATVSNHRVLWGYWNCVVDTTTGTVDLIPTRGVMMHVNAVEWMQPPAGSVANLGIAIIDDSLWLTEGRIDIDVTLNHPFPGLDQYTGFDVMGVFITDGHEQLLCQSGVRYSDGGDQDATMRNLDGYTRWWNQDEFDDPSIPILSYIPGVLGFNAGGLDAELNPYKYFTDGIGTLDDEALYLANNPADRGKFTAGAQITRRYELQWPMPGPQFAFDYAVVASWENPTVVPPVNIPDDFPITANALEPVALSVTDNSDLFYDDVNETHGGDVDLYLEIYDWQGLIPGQSIPDTIDKVIVEFQNSDAFPGGTYHEEDSTVWEVASGLINSSVWHVEIPGLAPVAMGETSVMIIFETNYDYDNGFGTNYPVGQPLSSYFAISIEVYGAAGVPVCEDPVPEFTNRNYLEIEGYSINVTVPGGTEYTVDWSIVPYGDPKDWQTITPQPPPATDIVVNWYVATGADLGPPTLGPYEVCASVYNAEGVNFCCTSVTVDDIPGLGPVAGQDGLTPAQQPDHGAEPCDIAVYNSGSSSTGELLYQDAVLSEVRMYRFNDDYSSITGLSTLDTTGYPAPLDDPMSWVDYHKFDLSLEWGLNLMVTSASDTWPSITDPDSYNINDPYHCWILPYWNQTGSVKMLGFYGDWGYNATPPSPPDPDAAPWKHFVDWTSGAVSFDERMYGLMTISEEWLPAYPAEQHPGTIWGVCSWAPYDDIATNYQPLGLGGLSTQYSVPGDVDDTDPGLMALATDDAMPVETDWSSTPDDLMSNIVVWYMLSSEATGADRKVHIIWLPEDIDNGFDIYYTDSYIGNGSLWGVDFGGTAVPVDIEVINAVDENFAYSNTYDWLAVLLDTGTGGRVDVFQYDPFFGSLVLVDQYAVFGSGTPHALDIDTEEFEIHVLYETGGSYRVTVLEFTP